jgi:hypothetical protein
MRGRRGASTNCGADAECGGPRTIPIPVTAATIRVTAATIRVTAAAIPATGITAAAAVPATTITAAAAAGVPATAAAATVDDICEGIVKPPYARGAEHL